MSLPDQWKYAIPETLIFYSYMFNDRYAKQVDKNYCNTRFSSDGMNGHTDSVCNLLMNYSETNRKLLWGLQKPF